MLLKLHSRNDKELADRYRVNAVPMMLMLDEDGRERFEFPPAPYGTELLPLALLGKARLLQRVKRYGAAGPCLERALELAPTTWFRPEILYYLGLGYAMTGDGERANNVMQELQSTYKETVWGAVLSGE